MDEFDFGPLVSMAHLEVFETRFDPGTLDSGERSLPFGVLVDRIIIKVAGNQDRHKSSDESDLSLRFPWPIYMFFEMRFDLGTLDSGERLLPFGLLV